MKKHLKDGVYCGHDFMTFIKECHMGRNDITYGQARHYMEKSNMFQRMNRREQKTVVKSVAELKQIIVKQTYHCPHCKKEISMVY